MKRQTRLTPAEGGKFAGPIGTPVPPNAADLGVDLGDSAFQQRSHARREDFFAACAAKGIESFWSSSYHLIFIQGDKVLMTVARARFEFSTFDETMAILDEMLLRASATPYDIVRRLDAALEQVDVLGRKLSTSQVLLDDARRERDAQVQESSVLYAELAGVRLDVINAKKEISRLKILHVSEVKDRLANRPYTEATAAQARPHRLDWSKAPEAMARKVEDRDLILDVAEEMRRDLFGDCDKALDDGPCPKCGKAVALGAYLCESCWSERAERIKAEPVLESTMTVESIEYLNPCPNCGQAPCCYEGDCGVPF